MNKRRNISTWLSNTANQSTVSAVVASCALLLVGHHFVVTALYVLPPNMLTIGAIGYLRRYIHPMFAQQWALFAPDPSGATKHFVVFCRFEGESREQGMSHVAQPAARHDAIQRRYRIGPGLRMARALTPTAWIMPPTDTYTEALKKRKAHEPTADADLTKALARIVNDETGADRMRTAFLGRVGSYACKESFPSQSTREVRPSLVVVEALPFPERHSGKLQTPTRFDMDWLPCASLEAGGEPAPPRPEQLGALGSSAPTVMP